MKKWPLLILAMGISLAKGQDLLKHVPASAECVISINGNTLTNKIGKRKIENSEAFLALTEDFLFKGRGEGKLSDVGIDLKNDFVFFFNADTSMEYMGYLYGIDKKRTFETYIEENAGEGEKRNVGDFSILFYEGDYDFLAWNKNYALFVSVDYLHEDLRPLEENSTMAWYYDYLEPVEEVEEAACEEGACEGGEATEVTEMTEEEMKAMEADRQAKKEAEEKRKAERIEKLRLAYINQITPIFQKSRPDHILTNKQYTKGKENSGDAYLWITKNDNVNSYRYYRFYYERRRYYRRFMYSINNFFGNEVAINAMLDKDIKIKSNLSFDAEISQYFKEIYSSKISKELLPYVNADKALAVSSFSVDAEKVWQYYPRIYAKMYESWYNRDDEDYSEEMSVFLDFVEIFMDEKALGEMATGDAIFVLKDLVQVEVKYTTYEYNIDYSERKEVEKTRTETFPEFLGMFTTKNKGFLEKLLGLAVKHEVMYRDNQYYYTDGENRDFPFQLGFTIQNGIAFIGSDMKEIKSISDGTFKGNVSQSLTKEINGNQSFMHMDLPALLSKIPNDHLNTRELKAMDYARENTRPIQMLSNMEGESVKSYMHADIPEEANNAAEYLWDFMEEMYRIDQEGRNGMD